MALLIICNRNKSWFLIIENNFLSSGRQSSTAGRGTGRAGTSVGNRERVEVNKTNIPTSSTALATMSSSSHQQDNMGNSGNRPREQGTGSLSQPESSGKFFFFFLL